jgi:hypothetical protein
MEGRMPVEEFERMLELGVEAAGVVGKELREGVKKWATRNVLRLGGDGGGSGVNLTMGMEVEED